MKARHLAAALGGAALLGSCTAKPSPQPAQAPPTTVREVPPAPPPPPPPPSLDWPDLPLTPGDWVYSSDAAGSQALYGPPASEAHFILRCERARRQILLSKGGAGAARALVVRTTALERSLPASARTEPLPYTSATLPASDPLLDAMAFSRGRFTIEAEGQGQLVLPAWPEPARVIEDCRG
jgi:hypothetical protein